MDTVFDRKDLITNLLLSSQGFQDIVTRLASVASHIFGVKIAVAKTRAVGVSEGGNTNFFVSVNCRQVIAHLASNTFVTIINGKAGNEVIFNTSVVVETMVFVALSTFDFSQRGIFDVGRTSADIFGITTIVDQNVSRLASIAIFVISSDGTVGNEII